MVNLVTSTMSKDDTREADVHEEQDVEEEAVDTEESEDTDESEEAEASSKEDSADDKHEVIKQRAIKQRLQKKLAKKQDNSAVMERLERLELRQEGYADNVIDEIQALGGRDFVEKNTIAKRIIQEMQEQSLAEKAASVSSSGGSATKTKYSVDDLSKMSSEEMEKHLPRA